VAQSGLISRRPRFKEIENQTSRKNLPVSTVEGGDKTRLFKGEENQRVKRTKQKEKQILTLLPG